MRIYLAGKINQNDWRHTIVDELRNVSMDDGSIINAQMPGKHFDKIPEFPVMCYSIFGEHDYTGPYFISCDHGCYHGPNLHGLLGAGCSGEDDPSFERRDIPTLCRNAITISDLVFAWIDDTSAHGTIAEIAYAHAIGKKVIIASPVMYGDLWFVYQFCSDQSPIFSEETAKDALKHYLEIEYLRTMPYAEYLQTEHWQRVRLAALDRAEHRCQVCNTNKRTLHVHHRTYERRGNEQHSDLIVLCADCHRVFHENGKLAK